MKILFTGIALFGLTASAASTWVFAAPQPAKESKVIDLGDLEVVGEVRRPHLFVVESGKALDPLLAREARNEWLKLETELTTVATQEGAQP